VPTTLQDGLQAKKKKKEMKVYGMDGKNKRRKHINDHIKREAFRN
jgi:hypothetical protein